MNECDFAVVQSFKQKMVERSIPVQEIVVFGSRARGDASPDSDLDVLVIVEEKNPAIRTSVSDCAWEAGFESGVVIQSLVRTSKEWYEGPEKNTFLFKTLQREGIPV